ncbi:PAS domain-containing protein [Pseudomonas aeruginosa]|nr:PAS domain-containing protein [Pseudomonas aeruginosa]
MFTRKYRQMNADLQQQLAAERLHMAALDRSMARVEFDPDGNIIDANENFLTLLGYRRDEILGKPHRQLCDGAYAQSEDYRRFGNACGAANTFPAAASAGTREGRPLWLEATYNPYATGRVDCSRWSSTPATSMPSSTRNTRCRASWMPCPARWR